MNKFKVWDRVKIISNSNGHGFCIGEIVTLVSSGLMINKFAGNSAEPPNYLQERDFELVAPKIPSTTTTCSNCSCSDQELQDIDGESYCSECVSELFIVCEQCSEYHSIDNALVACDRWYCSESCANRDGYNQCRDCSDWHITDNGYDRRCESCSQEYTTCEDCGRTVHNDDMHYDDDADEYYCDSCHRQSSRLIKSSGYAPSEFLYAKMPWENTTYLGIELEVETSNNREGKAEKLVAWLTKHKLHDRVYIKEDGSLDNGFEIVFHPSTLQAIHKKFPMRAFLSYCSKIGLKSFEEGTCGLHVHLSKQDMTPRALWAGKLLFWRCRTQLIAFSGREDSDHGLNYCKFDRRMPEKDNKQEFGRYCAFNISASMETVELRLFRGTLDYKRFLASLQFSDAFGEYIKEVSVVFIKSKSAQVVWSTFLAWCSSKRRYGQFLAYVRKNKIS